MMLINAGSGFRFSTEDKKPAAEGNAKKEETKEEPPKKGAEEKKTADKTAKKGEESSTSSSDEESPESLSKDDVQKIKKLIGDQDKEIVTLKEQVKQYKEKLVY
jgi:hypothetical protein